MDDVQRSTNTVTTTRVLYVAKPLFKTRENGPHLSDFRAFAAACEGLPDDAYVRIAVGHADEGGRHNVTFEIVYKHPEDEGA